jgi:hypothetical protein
MEEMVGGMDELRAGVFDAKRTIGERLTELMGS